jgi:hypothetical protein
MPVSGKTREKRAKTRLPQCRGLYTLRQKGASILLGDLAGDGSGCLCLSRKNWPSRRSDVTTFDERKRGFENKFAHDEEMQFKAIARGNKLLGLWAAGLLGKSGDEANTYAMSVVKADFEEPGHEDVYRKVSGDLGDRADEKTIRAKITEVMAEAKVQLMNEHG